MSIIEFIYAMGISFTFDYFIDSGEEMPAVVKVIVSPLIWPYTWAFALVHYLRHDR